ncbi:MAG: IMP dehydrogenase [Candidatus Aenigmarchaeota archaeon]|nr:IMP dehydrogenase [Candidatus Aenigmarchaeota archaeon]
MADFKEKFKKLLEDEDFVESCQEVLFPGRHSPKIIGEYTGTTYKDFLIEPGHTEKDCSSEDVNTETTLAGVKLGRPFLMAAMRSVVDKRAGLEGGKNGIMPVAPRGLLVGKQAEIVTHVRDNEIKPGDIEVQKEPVCLHEGATLGEALDKTQTTGHSNIPVKNRMAELVGMFTYSPKKHDREDSSMVITGVMKPFKRDGEEILPVLRKDASDEQIKSYMKSRDLRIAPILDGQDRLEALVFMQQTEAYKIGAAVDTRPGWQKRAERMVEAGAHMLFIDTSDAYSDFAKDVVLEYNGRLGETCEAIRTYKRQGDGPPLCAGNVVTRGGFRHLADAGADVIKVGMGSGSICITNMELGVGAPPMWAVIEVSGERDKYFKETGKYIPIIADGGIEDTWDINVALTHADAVMGGRIFAGFEESAAEEITVNGKRRKVYYGEDSPLAVMASGNRDRYHMGEQKMAHGLYQGVAGTVPYAGFLKPGVELYTKALEEAMSHAGAHNLKEFRESRLIRLSEQAGRIARPHGIHVIED